MPSLVRAPGHRRLASLLLAAVAVAAIAGPPAVTATTEAVDDAAIAAAESAMVTLLNADRTERGLIPVRVDTRLMAIARARSVDMVTKGYFSHTQPDGQNVFDILTAKHITWYNAGEIIAWNNYPMDSTASAANRQWLGSPGHYAIVTSTDYNYVGVGLAVDPDTGKKVWTAVYLKGPDRTAARASTGTPALGSWLTTNSRRATVSWSGYDPKLQVLTAGLRSFYVQVRTDGLTWKTVSTATTNRSWSFTVWKGHRYEVRVSPLDRAGNRGAWVTSVVDFR
jgi:uncharacterized protein YkwD